MRKIFKYPIEPCGRRDGLFIITVKAPRGSTPLCVMRQNGTTCIWMEVDTGKLDDTDYRFACVGTGHGAVPAPDEGKYFGSVVADAVVWHFYWM